MDLPTGHRQDLPSTSGGLLRVRSEPEVMNGKSEEHFKAFLFRSHTHIHTRKYAHICLHMVNRNYSERLQGFKLRKTEDD